MATYQTWDDLKAKVLRDLDLEGETFITSDEMLGYANEAIDEVERQVHTLYEDYFLSRSTITLVSGTEEYALPTDIYAMKVRSVVYRNGSTVIEIPRIRDWQKFIFYEEQTASTATAGNYRYFILNETAGAPRLLLTPTPTESGAYVKIWYLRNAAEMEDGDSVCDLPEAANYIIQYIKVRCYEKDGHPMLAKAMQDLEAEKQTTVATLANMVPDANNLIEADTSHYDSMT